MWTRIRYVPKPLCKLNARRAEQSRTGDGFIRLITNKDDGGVSEEGGEDDDDGGDLHEGAASVSEESKQAEYRGDERVLIH